MLLAEQPLLQWVFLFNIKQIIQLENLQCGDFHGIPWWHQKFQILSLVSSYILMLHMNIDFWGDGSEMGWMALHRWCVDDNSMS